jgi:predicted transcriptional regulator
MSRAEEFLKIYNELSDYLYRKYKEGQRTGFTRIVDIASAKDPLIRSFNEDLREFADLRNAIVHDRSYPDQIIAEPNERCIDRFREIYKRITRPNLVYPTFKANIEVFAIKDNLRSALRYMRDKDYSQIVVRDENNKSSLLTAEAITRWLADRVDILESEMLKATIGDALKYIDKGNFLAMGRNETVYKAKDAFDNSTEPIMPELCAIIITHSGKLTEKPIGIITPWDMLDIKNY